MDGAVADLDPGAPRRLDVVALLRESIGLLLGSIGPLVGAGVLIALARGVAGQFVERGFAWGAVDYLFARGLVEGEAPSVASIAANVGLLVAFLVTLALGHLALTAAALKRAAGEPVRAAEIAASTLRSAVPAVGAYVAVGGIVLVGLLGLVVPGLWLAGVYAVTSAVVAAEGRRRGILARARALTRGNRTPLAMQFVAVQAFSVGIAHLTVRAGEGLPLPADSAARVALVLVLSAVTEGWADALSATAEAVAYRRLRATREEGGLGAVFA